MLQTPLEDVCTILFPLPGHTGRLHSPAFLESSPDWFCSATGGHSYINHFQAWLFKSDLAPSSPDKMTSGDILQDRSGLPNSVALYMIEINLYCVKPKRFRISFVTVVVQIQQTTHTHCWDASTLQFTLYNAPRIWNTDPVYMFKTLVWLSFDLRVKRVIIVYYCMIWPYLPLYPK